MSDESDEIEENPRPGGAIPRERRPPMGRVACDPREQLARRAADLRAAYQALGRIPAADLERVDVLRRQIKQGTYQVPANALAEKLLRR